MLSKAPNNNDVTCIENMLNKAPNSNDSKQCALNWYEHTTILNGSYIASRYAEKPTYQRREIHNDKQGLCDWK